MAFVFSRVDDRAIHGQTVTLWSKIFPNNGIILVDDDIANDEIMRRIYKNAAVGINVYIYTTEEAFIKAKQAADSSKPYILIARTPIVFEALVKKGIDIGNRVTLGPVSSSDDRKNIAQFTSLNKQEIESCNYLALTGREVVFQNIPSTKEVFWKIIE